MQRPIAVFLLSLLRAWMSAYGTKRTWQSRSLMAAFGGKADIGLRLQCLLLTQSGHQRLRIGALPTDPEPHFAGRKRLV
jgi:hypothetical protein